MRITLAIALGAILFAVTLVIVLALPGFLSDQASTSPLRVTGRETVG